MVIGPTSGPANESAPKENGDFNYADKDMMILSDIGPPMVPSFLVQCVTALLALRTNPISSLGFTFVSIIFQLTGLRAVYYVWGGRGFLAPFLLAQ